MSWKLATNQHHCYHNLKNCHQFQFLFTSSADRRRAEEKSWPHRLQPQTLPREGGSYSPRQCLLQASSDSARSPRYHCVNGSRGHCARPPASLRGIPGLLHGGGGAEGCWGSHLPCFHPLAFLLLRLLAETGELHMSCISLVPLRQTWLMSCAILCGARLAASTSSHCYFHIMINNI